MATSALNSSSSLLGSKLDFPVQRKGNCSWKRTPTVPSCASNIPCSNPRPKFVKDLKLDVKLRTCLISSAAAACILFGGNALGAAPLIEDAAVKGREIQESIGRLTSPSKSGSGLDAPGLDQSAFLANKIPDETEGAKKSRELVAKSQLGDRIEPETFGSEQGTRRDQNIYGTFSEGSPKNPGNLYSVNPSPAESGSKSLKPGIEKDEVVGSSEFSSEGGKRYQNIFEPLQESAKEAYGSIVNKSPLGKQSIGSLPSQPSQAKNYGGSTPSLAKDILGRARERAQTERSDDSGGGKKDFGGQGRSDFDEGGAIFSSIQDSLKSGPKTKDNALVGELPKPSSNPPKQSTPYKFTRDILGRSFNAVKSGLSGQ